MSTITADTQTEKIFAWRRGFNAMHLIDIGVEIGLFKALAGAAEGLTSAALAQQLSLNAHFVNVWCTTAYSFELLEADEATRQFKLAPIHRQNSRLARPSSLSWRLREARHRIRDGRFSSQRRIVQDRQKPFRSRAVAKNLPTPLPMARWDCKCCPHEKFCLN